MHTFHVILGMFGICNVRSCSPPHPSLRGWEARLIMTTHKYCDTLQIANAFRCRVPDASHHTKQIFVQSWLCTRLQRPTKTLCPFPWNKDTKIEVTIRAHIMHSSLRSGCEQPINTNKHTYDLNAASMHRIKHADNPQLEHPLYKTHLRRRNSPIPAELWWPSLIRTSHSRLHTHTMYAGSSVVLVRHYCVRQTHNS